MPIDEIPPEIIQRVFRLCCGSVAFDVPREFYGSQSGTTQVTLSLVWSRWRAIALNTSTLWGDAMVHYNACTSPAPRPSSFRFVRKWLKRAGMTPISLSISVYEATCKSEIDAVLPLLSSFRIKNLELESIECKYLLVPFNKSYHYLETLHLTFDELAQSNHIFPLLPKMPSLKELRLCLNVQDFVDVIGVYFIPWHQLRVIVLDEYPWPSQMLFKILPLCKSLVKCTLFVELEKRQDKRDIVLPNLGCLVLVMSDVGNVDPIIRSLIVPNLRSLHIKSCSRYSLSPEALVIMAQRSGFKRLTYLSLSKTEQPVDVKSLLGCMPTLKCVTLRGPLMFQPGTFDDLSSGMIGPQLEEVNFGIMSDEEILLLLEAVGQRHEKAKTVSDIRPFTSVTCRTRDLMSHEKLAKKCSEAFDVNVTIHVSREGNRISDSDESDPDSSTESSSDEESYMDEEPGSNPGAVSVSDEEESTLGAVSVSDEEESTPGEESHSFGESESDEAYSFQYSSSDEEYWESDQDIDLDSHSGE